MLILQGVTYAHSNKDLLFTDLNVSIHAHEKIALIGNNGAGKSTLLNILAGNLLPSSGIVKTQSKPYYVPQLFDKVNDQTIAQALKLDGKLTALKQVLHGIVSNENLETLDNDWTIEERCKEAFSHWGVNDLELDRTMGTLSGGQKTKVFLAGIMIHQPDVVLLDEPSNHLDRPGRNMLYEYITNSTATLVVVSHDRTLLNLLNTVYELSKHGVSIYGGNFDFYKQQKVIERDALHHELKSKEKELRKAKETERESLERKQKLDARGKKKQEKSGLPTISMNTFRNQAEKSTARLKNVHTEKINAISGELGRLRTELPDADKMKMDLDQSALHRGKVLITATNINITRVGRLLWNEALSFQIVSGERMSIYGSNGSGKTTLLKLVLGEISPSIGILHRAEARAIYIDQDYSFIDNHRTIYEQAQHFNVGSLQEHEIKIRLNRFLFTRHDWDKSCATLSGGEKMRLMLCCLTIGHQAPDIIVLDEPTNNLDIENIEILTSAIRDYEGTVIVVSHDAEFLQQIRIDKTIELNKSIERLKTL